jgi:hypothetical protein
MFEYIAGRKTIADWIDDRKKLMIGGDPILWKYVFNEYFEARLKLRYLEPIQVIQEYGTFKGEGFSIVAIQCTLIEFLQSTVQGISYKYIGRGGELGPYEYSSSSDIFKTFLTTQAPFSAEFTSDLAKDFYVNVRCGLLHEARTKGGWRIHAVDPTGQNHVVEGKQKIIYRDNFQKSLLQFVTNYGTRLQTDITYQEAFIRKYDSLIN